MNNQEIKIYFDIQKPFYYPGEQILGSILIEFFNSINSNQITIISKGKQYIKINRKNISREINDSEDSFDEESDENNENKNDNTNIENIDKTKTIFKYKKKLNISNGYISKGKYTFPFEIDIPDNIPSSFLYLDNNIYIEIIYTLKIKFDDLSYKEVIPIIIRQKEKSFNYPQFNEYKKILGECCWERGQTNIKISPIEKYNLLGNNIKLNVLINNEQSGMKGTPLNIEIYRKIIFFPKDKSQKIRITKLVGKAKGKDFINPRKNFNEDISIKIKENKFISFEKEQTKAYKYFKNKKIVELLTPSIKSDLIICEYDIYVESQFVGWFKEELGAFNKVILYPPEKGILIPDIDNISKEFLNSLVIKKIFLNDEIKEDEIILGKNKKDNKNENKTKKGKEQKEKTPKIRKNKNKEYFNDEDKENININNEDINENFNINDYKKTFSNIRELNNFDNFDENMNVDKFKKNLDKNFLYNHELDEDFFDNTSDF